MFQTVKIKGCMVRKRIPHKLGQVQTSQQTASSCRKRLFRTRIDPSKLELLRIAQKVPLTDTVPEQCPRLSVIPVNLGDMSEQLPCIDLFFNRFPGSLPGIMQTVHLIVFYGFHEFPIDADGNIGFCHLVQICLQIHKSFHIRMRTVNGDHQCAPASVLSDQLRYQRIQLHKGHGAAGLFCRIIDLCSPRRKTRNIHSAAAAVAVSARQFLRTFKNTLNIILRRRHHITVGQTDLPPLVLQSPVGKNSASEQKLLLTDQLGNLPVSPADPLQPLFKIFPILAVFIFPDIHPQLVILPQPFFDLHVFSFFLLQIVSIVKRIAVHAVNRNTLMLPHETIESNVTFWGLNGRKQKKYCCTADFHQLVQQLRLNTY